MNKLVPDLSRLLGFKLAGQVGNDAVVTGPKIGKITDIAMLTGPKIGKLPPPG